jgi:hypothetical protein
MVSHEDLLLRHHTLMKGGGRQKQDRNKAENKKESKEEKKKAKEKKSESASFRPNKSQQQYTLTMIGFKTTASFTSSSALKIGLPTIEGKIDRGKFSPA